MSEKEIKNDEKRISHEARVSKVKRTSSSNCRKDKNHKGKREAF